MRFRQLSELGCPRNKQKKTFGSNRNKLKLNLFRLIFGLFRCFGPVSKQPKQTYLFRNKPKKTKKNTKEQEKPHYQTVLKKLPEKKYGTFKLKT
jgi:hypothetical protein